MTQTTTSSRNPTESRAIQLLGAGYPIETVAASCGVEVSRISQLMSDEEFKNAVTEIRVQNLQKHNKRDEEYDALEDKLLSQLKQTIPMLMRPLEITKVLGVINAAKRRGVSSVEQVINQQNIVAITMPTTIVNKFTTNVNNQVIKAGAQDLLTIQSSALKDMSSRAALEKLKGSEEVLPAPTTNTDQNLKESHDENGSEGTGET